MDGDIESKSAAYNIFQFAKQYLLNTGNIDANRRLVTEETRHLYVKGNYFRFNPVF